MFISEIGGLKYILSGFGINIISIQRKKARHFLLLKISLEIILVLKLELHAFKV